MSDDLEGHRSEITVTSSREFHQKSALVDDDPGKAVPQD
jgi:hypothetical protein